MPSNELPIVKLLQSWHQDLMPMDMIRSLGKTLLHVQYAVGQQNEMDAFDGEFPRRCGVMRMS